MEDLLYGNEVAESAFWERLRTPEIEGETVNKPSKKENFFFLSLQCITRDPPKECVCIVIKNFKVIENKCTRNKEEQTNAGSKENNDVVGKLLEIEHLWKDNLHLHRSGKDLLMNNFWVVFDLLNENQT